jgi:beta-galactosidase/beta-glucuronidase
MRIVSLNFDVVRATPAVAEFLARVELEVPLAGREVTGRAAGPRCPGVSTVEVNYPMTMADAGGTAVTLRCVIPEPNLWTAEGPFSYEVVVELRANGARLDARSGVVAFRGR